MDEAKCIEKYTTEDANRFAEKHFIVLNRRWGEALKQERHQQELQSSATELDQTYECEGYFSV